MVADFDTASVAQRLASLINKMNNSGSQVEIFSEEECMALLGDNFTGLIDEHHWNLACLPHAPTLNSSKIAKSLVLFVMALFSLVGNLGTMWSIHKSKRRRHGHIYYLLFHLSIADLCVTFWCILGEAIWHLTVEWKVGVVECKAFKFAQMFSLYLSAYIMVLIGVDRFIAIKYPLKSMSNGLCCRFVSVCWILSAILSFPQIIVFDVRKGPFQEPFYQCVTHGVYTAEWQEHLYTFFTLLFTFIIPLAILGTTYILTVYTLHRLQVQELQWSSKKLKGNEEFQDLSSGSSRTLVDPNRRKIIRRAKMKSLRISVAIVCAFLICWTPYYVAMIIYLFSEDKNLILDSGDLLSTVIFFFGMANSFCNPIIYGVFHLWRPRRKELQRGNSSSRKTLLTNVSFQRKRSATQITTGPVINDLIGISETHPLTPNGRSPLIKNCFQQWIIRNPSPPEGNTVL